MDRPTLLRQSQLAVRAAIGAGVALALATWLDLPYPIYAFLGAVIVTDLSPAATRRLGWQRTVSTAVGASCGAVLAGALPANPWTIGLGVGVAMLLCALVRIPEGAKVGGYICGIAMLSYGAEPWSYASYRFLETVLGIVVAWAVSLVPPLLHLERPAEAPAASLPTEAAGRPPPDRRDRDGGAE